MLAEEVRDAYGDLFELNINAHKMTKEEVKNKLKTLTQGQFSDDVLGKWPPPRSSDRRGGL